MSFQKIPSGSRGARMPSLPAWLTGPLQRMMINQHRRKGDRFRDMDVLYLSTVGARTGERRLTPVAHIPDGDDAWFIIASNGGAVRHPSWYHNIAAHPDQVWIEVGGRRLHVTPDQLEGQRRDDAWRRITAIQPRYAGYQQKTDRVLPVLRLARTS